MTLLGFKLSFHFIEFLLNFFMRRVRVTLFVNSKIVDDFIFALLTLALNHAVFFEDLNDSIMHLNDNTSYLSLNYW
jgi:hypothetical protein